jgi:FkbM family methyltransferase
MRLSASRGKEQNMPAATGRPLTGHPVDLYNHSNPPFTNWVIANGLLRENFVVIDIGCQGGEHPRWSFLGDKLEFYGFDPIEEAINALRQAGKPGRKYFELALGERDGESEFLVTGNTFASSFLWGKDCLASNGFPEIRRGTRKVPLRRLDSLFAERLVPTADYIKLDCEGYEPYVLEGARKYLAASAPFCVTTETSFNASSLFPHSHFRAVNEILTEYRLRVFDINVVRAARSSCAAALRGRPWPEPDMLSEAPHLDVGAPATLDVVFCRDFVAEAGTDYSDGFALVAPGRPTADRLIKAMINFELHGLMDCAFDIAARFRDVLELRFDVDRAAELLLARAPHARNTADVTNCLSMVAKLRAEVLSLRDPLADMQRKILAETQSALAETQTTLKAMLNSTSWQITAPLRRIMSWLRR